MDCQTLKMLYNIRLIDMLVSLFLIYSVAGIMLFVSSAAFPSNHRATLRRLKAAQHLVSEPQKLDNLKDVTFLQSLLTLCRTRLGFIESRKLEYI